MLWDEYIQQQNIVLKYHDCNMDILTPSPFKYSLGELVQSIMAIK